MSKAEEYFNLGNIKKNLGKYEEAIKDYDEAIRINPEYSEAFCDRGFSKDNLGKYKEAIKDFSEAIRINSEYNEAFYNRGVAKTILGKYEEAIKDYDEAIRINPKDIQALSNRGATKTILGKYEEAIKDFSEAIRINPKGSDIFSNRGFAKANLGKYEEAIKDYNEAIKINPEGKSAIDNRIIARKNLEDAEKQENITKQNIDKNALTLTTKSGQFTINTLNDKIIEDFLWKFNEFSNFSFFKNKIVDDFFSCTYENVDKWFHFKKFSNEQNNTVMKDEYEKIQKKLSYQDGREVEKALNFCRTIFLRSEDFNIVKILNRFIDDIKKRLNSLPQNKVKEIFPQERSILLKRLEEQFNKWKNFEDSDLGGFPDIRLSLNIELNQLTDSDKNDLLKKIKAKTASFKIIRETSLNEDETVLTVDIKTIFNLYIYGDSLHYEKLKRILWKNVEDMYGKELLNFYLFFYIIILNTDLSIQFKEISYFHEKLGLS